MVIVNHVAVSSEGCGAVGTGWCPREARKGKQRTIDPTPISSLPGAQREIDWACSETAVEVWGNRASLDGREGVYLALTPGEPW